MGTDDPKLQQFLIDLAKTDGTLKRADMLKILNEDQYGVYQGMKQRIGEVLGEQPRPLMAELMKRAPNFRSRVNSIINYNFSRMVKIGIREGKEVDEIFNSFQKQINDPEFYEKVVPLILKKFNFKIKLDTIEKNLDLILMICTYHIKRQS